MLFNSLAFIAFYIIVTSLYFLLPHKYRWLLLLVASCYFYMAFVPVYILILGGTILIDYIAGIWIEKSKGRRRKNFLILSLIANIGVLCVFKYYNFINDNISLLLNNLHYQNPIPYLNIILPIGLSFHTFQAMSYTIEVYRGNTKAERHFGIYSLYVMFYPQLVAGPIERPQNILPQMHTLHKFEYDKMVSGLKLMLWGFFKKLVVADRLSIYVDSVFGHPSSHNGTTVVIASFFFAVQIYCDFSGYTDIAIGCARTMGFNLMKNFNRPYFAKSIKEFWSRWHISLSTWFRDYLYIPLGGNRVPIPRMCLNLLIVFTISGIWHGASYNFVIWGFLHGVFLITANIFDSFKKKLGFSYKLPSVINIGLTIILVSIAWIFFRANDVHHAFRYISDIFSKDLFSIPFSIHDELKKSIICILLIVVFLIIEWIGRSNKYAIEKMMLSHHKLLRWMFYNAIVISILLSYGKKHQFIYFQF